MVLILLLLCALSCSVHALSLFEAEEGANITIQLSSSTKTDLSSLHMNCRLRTVPLKLVFEMVGGVEETQSQDRQFSGRVQCDREALRLGQVWLHLTRLTPQDSGEYQCEITNYNSDQGGWTFISTEYFKLNVTQKDAILMTTAARTDDGTKLRGTPVGLLIFVSVFVTFVISVVVIFHLKRLNRS